MQKSLKNIRSVIVIPDLFDANVCIETLVGNNFNWIQYARMSMMTWTWERDGVELTKSNELMQISEKNEVSHLLNTTGQCCCSCYFLCGISSDEICWQMYPLLHIDGKLTISSKEWCLVKWTTKSRRESNRIFIDSNVCIGVFVQASRDRCSWEPRHSLHTQLINAVEWKWMIWIRGSRKEILLDLHHVLAEFGIIDFVGVKMGVLLPTQSDVSRITTFACQIQG